MINDKVYLRYLLENERDAQLMTYIEQNFHEESQQYQIWLMLEYPFFANKILDDYELSNEEKQLKYINKITYNKSNQGVVVLVDGWMGGGKTGFGCWSIDEVHKLKPNFGYFFVTKSTSKPRLPKWITILEDPNDVPNNCVALIDEGAIQLGSRRAMSRENKEVSDRIVQLRQRGIVLIILTQHIKMVDANVRRVTNIRIAKKGTTFETEGLSDDIKLIRNRLRPQDKSEAYIEFEGEYFKFSHELPEWWDDEKISKYMQNWDMREKTEGAGSTKETKENVILTKEDKKKEESIKKYGIS